MAIGRNAAGRHSLAPWNLLRMAWRNCSPISGVKISSCFALERASRIICASAACRDLFSCGPPNTAQGGSIIATTKLRRWSKQGQYFHFLLHEDSRTRSSRIRHAELFQGVAAIGASDGVWSGNWICLNPHRSLRKPCG
jgi:hypothetical protein